MQSQESSQFPTSKGARVQVLVRDNNVDQALKALKKKMQREGIFREMKLRGHYEKPSEKKAREKAARGPVADEPEARRRPGRRRARPAAHAPLRLKPGFPIRSRPGAGRFA